MRTRDVVTKGINGVLWSFPPSKTPVNFAARIKGKGFYTYILNIHHCNFLENKTRIQWIEKGIPSSRLYERLKQTSGVLITT